MRRPWLSLVFIIILTMIAVAIVRPNGEIKIYNFHKQFSFSQGLDLQGGVHLKYAMNLNEVPESDRAEAVKGVRDVMEKRINPLGVAEPVIQTSGSGENTKLIIELPGQKDVDAAIATIGKTARMTFQELDAESGGFKETDLTGADLKPQGASVGQNPTTLEPIIQLTFTDEGAKKFAAITERNVGQPIAIFLDDQPLQIATVQEQINGGQAQISGQFTIQEAQETVRLLNAGALPVPLDLIEQRRIGATLGQEAVQRSLVAGGVGLLMVSLFMMAYYRLLGVVAVISLLLYTLFSLAIFKALPVTLTLAGITGFILSIGMAVDANILIFERMKEEIREGNTLRKSIEEGFQRAWSSIRDSNASSIITALILYNFAASSLIKGFSLTLIIGILVSLFTAITVSRTLLYLFFNQKIAPATTPVTTQNTRLQTSRAARWR